MTEETNKTEGIKVDEDGFLSVTQPRSSRATFPSDSVPQVCLHQAHLSMTNSVWEDMGKPEWVEVLANPKKHLIKLKPKNADPEAPRRYMTGYRKVQIGRYGDEETYRFIKLSESAGRKNLMQAIQKGYYVPIGGNVYRYHGLAAVQR